MPQTNPASQPALDQPLSTRVLLEQFNIFTFADAALVGPWIKSVSVGGMRSGNFLSLMQGTAYSNTSPGHIGNGAVLSNGTYGTFLSGQSETIGYNYFNNVNSHECTNLTVTTAYLATGYESANIIASMALSAGVSDTNDFADGLVILIENGQSA